jgi:RNA polymerase sigma factor (sigma-70 family)
MSMTDRDLRFTAAFDELYARAFRVALRIVGERATAEDVAAEALTRAYDHWDRIGDDAGRRVAWTVRVTTNLAIDTTRRREAPAERIELAGGTDPTDRVAVRLALTAALRALPERQRQAVALRHLAGLPQAEVARALNVRPGTVAQHVHRGMAALRVALGEPAPQIEPHKEKSMNQPFDITVGDRRRGRVHAIVPFGAFVEIDGRHGLLHRDEFGVAALGVGQQVDVVVLAVASPRKRFSLRPAVAA